MVYASSTLVRSSSSGDRPRRQRADVDELGQCLAAPQRPGLGQHVAGVDGVDARAVASSERARDVGAASLVVESQTVAATQPLEPHARPGQGGGATGRRGSATRPGPNPAGRRATARRGGRRSRRHGPPRLRATPARRGASGPAPRPPRHRRVSRNGPSTSTRTGGVDHLGRSPGGAHTLHLRVGAPCKCRARTPGDTGAMTQTVTDNPPDTDAERAMVDALRAALRGEVIDRDHPGYDDARRVWNGLIDRHPAVIARCADVADVVEAVRIARGTTAPSRASAAAATRWPAAPSATTAWSSTCRPCEPCRSTPPPGPPTCRPVPPGVTSTGPLRSTDWPPPAARCPSPASPASPSAAGSA